MDSYKKNAGSVGDWRIGCSKTWQADIGRSLTFAEEAPQPLESHRIDLIGE
ncbi:MULTISPECIES: hypothetical protein [Pseudomonas]|uniref:Uncharacterized protein n=1 Tax=Pseudomonas helleri TaxID=1608996 RepID=A0A7X1XGX4_9PSED|nr:MULTISPECIES: hypothetical protein [Pseudomonas]MQT51943.1 hypothetical protein [Pseudomonas sp. FSL R10-2398]MQT90044.1 hypothetical protein [Pseudomonas helleri]